MTEDVPTGVNIRVVLPGHRLDPRGFNSRETIALSPLTLRAGKHGIAFLFRYGVLVVAGTSAEEESDLITSLRSRIVEPMATPGVDHLSVVLKSDGDDLVEPSGVVILKDASTERLQIVANALSKSVVLTHHESRIATAFDRIEPLALGIKRRGRSGREARELIRQIGDILLTQHRMTGRVAVEDKPDILWDHPGLERLYSRLEDEYELIERIQAIDRKLALVGETVGTLLELVQDQRSVRRDPVGSGRVERRPGARRLKRRDGLQRVADRRRRC